MRSKDLRPCCAAASLSAVTSSTWRRCARQGSGRHGKQQVAIHKNKLGFQVRIVMPKQSLDKVSVFGPVIIGWEIVNQTCCYERVCLFYNEVTILHILADNRLKL
jgi:hypothetical protein